jgi:hypothetical protein
MDAGAAARMGSISIVNREDLGVWCRIGCRATVAVQPRVVRPRVSETFPGLGHAVNVPAIIASICDFHLDKVANVWNCDHPRDSRVSAENVSACQWNWSIKSVSAVNSDLGG